MTTTIVSADVSANGELRLLTKATVVPDPTLSDKDIAVLANLSKHGRGKRTFRTKDAALRYLWSL